MSPALFNQGITPSELGISQEAFVAPLFYYPELKVEELIESEYFDLFAILREQTNPLPFPDVRLLLVPDYQFNDQLIRQWITFRDGVLRVTAAMYGALDRKDKWLFFMDTNGNGDVESRFVINGVDGLQGLSEPLAAQVRDCGSVILYSAYWFVRDLCRGSHFVSKVTPDKKSKSVEWMKSRTHYVLIHRAHPANSRQIKNGDRIEREGSLKRQAHTRRAHTRILRSPKFKNKVGQVIRVKSCWVGPSEWRENSSIYQIV